MASIVYNKFVKKFTENDIDLSLPNTYKIALLKSYPNSKEPAIDDDYSFEQLLPYECKDEVGMYDDSIGYQTGGAYTLFHKSTTSKSSNIQEYTCDGVTWYNTTLLEDNSAKYAIIYRPSDKLLISCYTFNNPITINEDTLRLSWFDIPVISFWIKSTQETPLGYDDKFIEDSDNAIENRVVTGGFKRYGVVINGEESPLPPLEDMDTLTSIAKEEIENLFEGM